MNREILLRGKRLDKFRPGEWIYGYYVPCCFGSFPCRPAIVPEPDGKWEPFEVDPSTVGQYTGLTDKNGKKIFEGDIIRFKYWCNGHMCWVGVVEYDYGAMYVVRGGSNQECESPFEVQLSRLGAERIEVIGSVHDNPELIGGEDDG